MPKLSNLEDLRRVRGSFQQDLQTREKTDTKIIIGMGTCGIAAGAREVMSKILEELVEQNLQANVTTVGCIGMCTEEPLVDIETSESGRITYGRITADKVPVLLQEHLARGRVVREWVVGQIN